IGYGCLQDFYGDKTGSIPIGDVWMANCYFAHNSVGLTVLLGFCDAGSGRPFHPFHHYAGSLARTGWGPFRSGGVMVKHQLLIVNRSRQRAPNLSASDRVLAGWLALWVRPSRLLRSAIVLKPSTLIGLHQTICKQKYRMLFSPNRRRKPGPKGPSAELINAVVEMKQRNPRWGCPRIAEPAGRIEDNDPVVPLVGRIEVPLGVDRHAKGPHFPKAKRPGQTRFKEEGAGQIEDRQTPVALVRDRQARLRHGDTAGRMELFGALATIVILLILIMTITPADRAHHLPGRVQD